jgi:hypothetical protein
LVFRLQQEAQRRGVQIDTIIAESLCNTLPAPPVSNGVVHRDVTGLAGVWTADDAQEFFAAIKDLEQVDEELWK